MRTLKPRRVKYLCKALCSLGSNNHKVYILEFRIFNTIYCGGRYTSQLLQHHQLQYLVYKSHSIMLVSPHKPERPVMVGLNLVYA